MIPFELGGGWRLGVIERRGETFATIVHCPGARPASSMCPACGKALPAQVAQRACFLASYQRHRMYMHYALQMGLMNRGDRHKKWPYEKPV